MTGADKITEKVVEHAKGFLSSVFMVLRTLQIHDAANRAVENAIRGAYESANALYSATGGFKIQFVDSMVFVNGTRVRFEGSLFVAIRALEAALRSKQIGGFVMTAPPSYEGVRTLVVELAKEGEIERSLLDGFSIDAVGLQTFGDQQQRVSVDRRVLAVQSYAKLILALREQLQRIRRERAEGKGSSVRLRVVRIVQDLVELVQDRPDFLLRLSTNLVGAVAEELHGANACLLALAMGQAIGLDRRDLVDLGMSALCHHLGSPSPDSPLERSLIDASTARMFNDAGVSRSSMLRAAAVAHQRKSATGRSRFRAKRPHLFARIVGVAVTYSQLVSGYGLRNIHRAPPLDALQVLMQDDSGRFDPDLIDLLINILRAFPVGCHVMLDTGEHALVTTHGGSSRWDRPIVAVRGERPRHLDLDDRRRGPLPSPHRRHRPLPRSPVRAHRRRQAPPPTRRERLRAPRPRRHAAPGCRGRAALPPRRGPRRGDAPSARAPRGRGHRPALPRLPLGGQDEEAEDRHVVFVEQERAGVSSCGTCRSCSGQRSDRSRSFEAQP